MFIIGLPANLFCRVLIFIVKLFLLFFRFFNLISFTSFSNNCITNVILFPNLIFWYQKFLKIAFYQFYFCFCFFNLYNRNFFLNLRSSYSFIIIIVKVWVIIISRGRVLKHIVWLGKYKISLNLLICKRWLFLFFLFWQVAISLTRLFGLSQIKKILAPILTSNIIKI